MIENASAAGYVENPAKTFLKRYRSMVKRRDSLMHAIDGAYGRATSCTARIKAINTGGGNAAYDRMAEDVSNAIDGARQLQKVVSEINAQLADILAAIESIPSEAQKTIITMRYIEGLSWDEINDQMRIERSSGTKLHGRALQNVKHWLEENGKI